MLEAALAADRRRLGDAHESTLVSMAQLGELLRDLGELPDAEGLLRECYSGRQASLGPDHPDTLRAKSLLAYTLHLRGKHDEGERLMGEALAVQRELLRDTNTDTILTMGMTGDVFTRRGQPDAALRLTSEALRLARGSLANDAIGLGRVTAQHGLALADARRNDEAKLVLQEAYSLMEQSGVTAHPDARRVAARLADLYERSNADAESTDLARAWRAKSLPRTKP
ncbi:MAG: tetratricopeptide repeat protein [Phycisphaerae bacterium]|nr:tetratricopeptide repeat protein [Phycisphaerae bacterium]